MCPGLTSPGAKLYPAAADTVVVSFFNQELLLAELNLYVYVQLVTNLITLVLNIILWNNQ